MIYTTLSPLCLHDPHEAWSPVRVTHPLSSAYKTHTKHGRRSESHTLSPLPIYTSMVAGKSHTPSLLCVQDPHEAWLPVRVTHPLCLQDPHEAWSRHTPPRLSPLCPHEAWSPVRACHRPLSPLCLQDPHEAWSPVRVTHPLSSPPTRPARSMVAGQSHTPPPLSARTKHGRRSEPVIDPLSPLCLQDPHETWILTVQSHTCTPSLLSTYKTRT